MVKQATITEAAAHLNIHVNTVRRRLNRGELQGHQEDGKWFVELPGEQATSTTDSTTDLITFLKEVISTKDEQIGILLHRLGEVKVLPAPKPSAWWRSLLRR